METIIGLSILFLIFWALFIRGALFKLIIVVFGFIGMRSYLWNDFPTSHHSFLIIMGRGVCYATAIPLVITVLAMATTSVKSD